MADEPRKTDWPNWWLVGLTAGGMLIAGVTGYTMLGDKTASATECCAKTAARVDKQDEVNNEILRRLDVISYRLDHPAKP